MAGWISELLRRARDCARGIYSEARDGHRRAIPGRRTDAKPATGLLQARATAERFAGLCEGRGLNPHYSQAAGPGTAGELFERPEGDSGHILRISQKKHR